MPRSRDHQKWRQEVPKEATATRVSTVAWKYYYDGRGYGATSGSDTDSVIVLDYRMVY